MPPKFDPSIFTERKARPVLAFAQGAAIGFGTSFLIDKLVYSRKFDLKQSVVTGLIGGVLDGTLDYLAARRHNREIREMKSHVERYLAEREQAEQAAKLPQK